LLSVAYLLLLPDGSIMGAETPVVKGTFTPGNKLIPPILPILPILLAF
jgi:hypothetical protein